MHGATVHSGIGNAETEFRVWAPSVRKIKVRLLNGGDFAMQPDSRTEGEFAAVLPAQAGDRYFYIVDENKPVPDPVSRCLPLGVHGPTEIIDPESFQWSDQSWRGLDITDYIIYELHVGAFTWAGTFDAAIERLDYLKNILGISAIELMPVAAFPGKRNWGYDGVSPYAVQASYGGPAGLKRLVDAAHRLGLAVVLDVVYNHLGNEGNYLGMFAPYFSGRRQTPWGDAVNYDGPDSAGVRRYVIENALYWVGEYHLDGLRLDAIQTIFDDSQPHIVAEIQENVQRLAAKLGRRVCVIAETDQNLASLVRKKQDVGFGLDAMWSDDFHHAVHAVLTGERQGYYQDFGKKEQIVRALNEGFVFQGEYFNFWKAKRGTPAAGVPLPAHVICIQNHDQVGNRARGERLTALVPRGARKLAAALLLLAPHTPLLFMGQEFDESAPFQFFTDFGDPQLQKAVSEGRRKEFKDFRWQDVPDPQDPATFERSKLHWDLAEPAGQNVPRGTFEMREWYSKLLKLRRRLVMAGERTCHAEVSEGYLRMQVPAKHPKLKVIARFPDQRGQKGHESGGWRKILASDEDGYVVEVFERAT